MEALDVTYWHTMVWHSLSTPHIKDFSMVGYTSLKHYALLELFTGAWRVEKQNLELQCGVGEDRWTVIMLKTKSCDSGNVGGRDHRNRHMKSKAINEIKGLASAPIKHLGRKCDFGIFKLSTVVEVQDRRHENVYLHVSTSINAPCLLNHALPFVTNPPVHAQWGQ